VIFRHFKRLGGTYLFIAFFLGFVAGGYVTEYDVPSQIESVTVGPADSTVVENPSNFTGRNVSLVANRGANSLVIDDELLYTRCGEYDLEAAETYRFDGRIVEAPEDRLRGDYLFVCTERPELL